MDGPNPPPKIAVQVSAAHTFDDGYHINWATTVPQDISPDDLDLVLNKMRAAMYTQYKWHRVFRLENEIDHSLRQIAQLTTNINLVDSRYPNREKAPVDARTARQQAVESILRNNDLVEVLRGEIDRTRHALNGG